MPRKEPKAPRPKNASEKRERNEAAAAAEIIAEIKADLPGWPGAPPPAPKDDPDIPF